MGFFFIGLIILLFCGFNEGVDRMSANYDYEQVNTKRKAWSDKYESPALTKAFFDKYNFSRSNDYEKYKICLKQIEGAEERFKNFEVTKQFIRFGYITGDIINELHSTVWGCDFLLAEHGRVPYLKETYGCVNGNKFGDWYLVSLDDVQGLVALKWIQHNLKFFGAGELIYDYDCRWIWKDRDGVDSQWNHREYNRKAKQRSDKEGFKYWYYTLDEYLMEKYPVIMNLKEVCEVTEGKPTRPLTDDDYLEPSYPDGFEPTFPINDIL